MRLTFLFIAFYLFSFSSFAQTKVLEDNFFEVHFIKNGKLKKKHPKPLIPKIHKGFRITTLELEVNSIDLKSRTFDPNKLYLINQENKIRYRPIHIYSKNDKKRWIPFDLITKKKPKKKSYLQDTYHPEIKDTFLNYSLTGFTDISIPINIGKGFKDRQVFHFKPKQIIKIKIMLYFYISSDLIDMGTLFYGKEKVAETKLR